MHINIMLKYMIHVKYIYNKKNINFYRNQTINQMNQKVLHNTILMCFIYFIDDLN